MRANPAPRKCSSARIPASRLCASVGGTGRIAFTSYFLKFEASFNKGAAWTQPFSRSKVNRRPGAATGQPWSDAMGGVVVDSGAGRDEQKPLYALGRGQRHVQRDTSAQRIAAEAEAIRSAGQDMGDAAVEGNRSHSSGLAMPG